MGMIFGTYLLLMALAGLHLFYYYPQLPTIMATHFDASGKANGWMTRDGFAGFYLVLQGFLMTVMCSVTVVLSRYPMLTNMPNKKYWLSPDRILATVKSLRNALLCLGVALGSTIIGIHQVLIVTSLKQEAVLSTGAFTALVLGFMGYIVAFTLWYYIRFRKPRDPQQE